MGMQVESDVGAVASFLSLNEPPAEQPAPSQHGAEPKLLEQGQGALSYWARRPGPLVPYGDPPPHATDRAVAQLNTDRALGELQEAQQEMVEANGSGNFRRIDEALMSLTEAQDNFEKAVKAEGADSVRARHPNDPATKTAVSAAELSIAQDRLAEVEAKIPNLQDIPAQEEGSRIQPPELYRELIDARRDVGVKTDALREDVNAQALHMRDQGMSREDALAELRAYGYSHVFGTASDKLENGKMPNTIGMNYLERRDVYLSNFERNASPEALAAFNRGEPVIFAIRHDTPLQANNERGVYDDRYVVLQRVPGEIRFTEFDGSQDPNTQYGDDMRDTHDVPWDKQPREVGPYADRVDFGIDAYSRVADGTIKMQEGPKEDHLYPENGDYSIQGDINGDGIFNDDYYRPAGNNGFQLHAGKEDYSHTGSGGCLTLPPHQWDAFKQATGVFDGDPNTTNSLYYVQVGESKMRY
jgi:hypothetical protein